MRPPFTQVLPPLIQAMSKTMDFLLENKREKDRKFYGKISTGLTISSVTRYEDTY